MKKINPSSNIFKIKNLILNELGFEEDPKKRLFNSVWKDKKNQQKFLTLFEKENNIKKMEDWYQIKTSDLINSGGRRILDIYKCSIYKLITSIYKEYDWKPWLFKKVPRSYWNNLQNQKKYLEWFVKQQNIQKMEDWYKLQITDLKKNGAKGLLAKYNNSLYKLLSTIYPEYDWKPWLFQRVPRSYWANLDNQKKYLEWIKIKFNIQKFDDWYKLTAKDIKDNGGAGLLFHYNGSLFQTLKIIYPEYDWKPWLMNNSPKSFWNKSDSITTYIQWLEKQLQIKKLDDWYNVSAKEISKYFQASSLLNKYGGLKSFLLHYYPNYNWNLELLEKNSSRNISKSQYRLFQLLEEIFPNETIEIN
jgi:hypothetical protein